MRSISFMSRGETLRGYVHEACESGPAPVIVMCHGFTGNCSEHGLFDDFGEAAAKAGYHVIRFDCAGSGASDGDFAKLTSLDGWVSDMRAAMDYVQTEDEIKPAGFITMGISMGAATALLTSEDARVKAAVGIAPVIYPRETFVKIFSVEKWEELRAGRNVHCEYAGSEFDAAPVFLDAAESLSVEKVLASTQKPVLLRFGTEDEVIGRDTARRVQGAAFANVRVDIVEGEDHGCMQHEDENIAAILDFLG